MLVIISGTRESDKNAVNSRVAILVYRRSFAGKVKMLTKKLATGFKKFVFPIFLKMPENMFAILVNNLSAPLNLMLFIECLRELYKIISVFSLSILTCITHQTSYQTHKRASGPSSGCKGLQSSSLQFGLTADLQKPPLSHSTTGYAQVR